MTRDLRERKTNRRTFLRDLAVAGGLAAVAGSSGAAPAGEATRSETSPQKRAGYRVTPHISKYYDKARI
jgi:hypothetical protein